MDHHGNLNILVVLFVFLAVHPGYARAESCTLYDPPTPGIHCFHGNTINHAVSASKTSWVVEFYSGWCGHCQHFAPAMKDVGREIEPWASVFKLGVLECTASKVNQEICVKYKIEAYPTLRFFSPEDSKPIEHSTALVGSRGKQDLIHLIINHIETVGGVPALNPLTDAEITPIPHTQWTPLVLIFEEHSSFVGRQLILDFSSFQRLVVHRVLKNNSGLLRHYSILELPSIIIELDRGDYHVIAGHSFTDPRTEFKNTILKYLQSHKASESTQRFTKHSEPDPVRATSATASHHPHRPIRINRVHKGDIVSAISYALRSEVNIHSIVSGSAYSSLLRFLILLEKALSVPCPAVAKSIQGVRMRLEFRSSAGFITRRDWNRILDTKLDPKLFPLTPQWTNCNGSRSHFRGYPCGLWMLMHTLTILTLPLPHPAHTVTQPTPNSRETLRILSGFVRNFFSCEHCRKHFSKMTESLRSESKVHHDGDAVLWLWEAHNAVNKRLTKDVSSDPEYPKSLFPTSKTCPYCYRQTVSANSTTLVHPTFNNTGFVEGEGLVEWQGHSTDANNDDITSSKFNYVWNRTAVLLYLWNFYQLNPPSQRTAGSQSGIHHFKPVEILEAAWPRKFKNTEHLHHKYYGLGKYRMDLDRGHGHVGGIGFNGIDKGICFMSYMMCFVFLGSVGLWLYKRRRYRKFLQYP